MDSENTEIRTSPNKRTANLTLLAIFLSVNSSKCFLKKFIIANLCIPLVLPLDSYCNIQKSEPKVNSGARRKKSFEF